MPKGNRNLLLFGFTVLLIFFMSSAKIANAAPLWEGPSLFCWTQSVLFQEDEQEQLFALMEKQGVRNLYQSIPKGIEDETLSHFLNSAAKRDVCVWLLTGDPSWGMNPEGTEMIRAVKRAAEHCKGLAPQIALRGVVMDCEPYLLEAWQKDAPSVMNSWVSAVKAAGMYASQNHLSLIVCVPYYLDEQGFGSQLEEMVRSCDALLVMNYFKKQEDEHIENEARMAKEAGKPLIVAYELQAPGKHGLTERNTYYHDGLQAVSESWDRLTERFDQEHFLPALHEYESLRELYERDTH